ncbi:tetratricopeptide repeat protein [Helicobacter cinaedi]|uniref:tetratricopeptide repeat protein n=1 Tax=Helicobacter cinaedi TaxID=213 RepID=UPI000CF0FD83|nr:tetratricopeptide repeat protein [Helicobacter cinaedi]
MRILFCLMLMCITFALASENEQIDKDNAESTLSPLVQSIRQADSLFYQGVTLWSKNSDEASDFLKKACDNKHPGACLYLGNYYEIKSKDKKDSKANLAKSQQFYQLGYENSIEACKEGAVEWCSIQAVALIDGHGVTKDIQKGLEYLEILCERDMENACFMLGTYYFYGINVKQDLQKSKKFTQKALELDSQACGENRLYACVISAEIYQQGLSVPQDLIKAKILYSRACEMDNQFACDYVKKLK